MSTALTVTCAWKKSAPRLLFLLVHFLELGDSGSGYFQKQFWKAQLVECNAAATLFGSDGVRSLLDETSGCRLWMGENRGLTGRSQMWEPTLPDTARSRLGIWSF